MNIFSYEFMQRAFIVGIFIAVITPLIGTVIVLKRLSNLGEALSHNSLAGITAGLALSIDPVIGAIAFSLFAAISIEVIRKSFKGFSEIATTIVLSLGIGLASIFSGFVKNAGDLNSYMFGSIVATTDTELYLIIGISIVIIIASILLYKQLFYITFDTEAAKLSGIKVEVINFVFMLLTAVTVAVAARSVGALIVSSLMVIPVACAMQISKSYKQTMVYSTLFGLFFTISGLFASFYLDLKTGGTIVLIGVFTLVVITIIKKFFK